MCRRILILFFIVLPSFLFSQQSSLSIDQKIEKGFKPVSDFIYWLVFYPVTISGMEVPIVVLILIFGGLFFTIYYRFANFRLAGVAVNATRGKYDEVDHYGVHVPEEGNEVVLQKKKGKVYGELTHFQALTAALSATVGLGNIAGVSIAIALGGPGATIWMILVGFLGMSTKIGEATLGVKYREIDEEGKTYGGPMYYLRKGLARKNLPVLGKVLAGMFAICVIGGSLGSGNMFQSNQAASQFQLLFGLEGGSGSGFWFGIVMALMVGLVIIGGIRRIGQVTERIVPFMAILFVGSALVILLVHYDMIPEAFGKIWDGAFNARSATGGLIGVMIVGFQRGAFSNEAGVGSSAIAHSAVRTRYPASEGLVASIGPFVDTVVICTMTALVIVITNMKHGLFEYANLDSGGNVILNATGESIGGVDLTSVAFESTIPHFSITLTIAVILFAFSTMLSWSYYGLQGWKYLFGKGRAADLGFKGLFLVFTVIGASSSMESVIYFADAMLFAMVFPNMIGLMILAPLVRKEVSRYLRAIRVVVTEGKVPEDR